MVFFVTSGFALRYKPLKQIHAGQRASLLDTQARIIFQLLLDRIVLGFSCCRTWIRLFPMEFTSLCALYYERWDIFLYISGMLLAELSLGQTDPASLHLRFSPDEKQKYNRIPNLAISSINAFKCLSPALDYVLCLISLYFLSYPGGSYPLITSQDPVYSTNI